MSAKRNVDDDLDERRLAANAIGAMERESVWGRSYHNSLIELLLTLVSVSGHVGEYRVKPAS